MNGIFRHISHSQWIMLFSVLVISIFMLLASNAQAQGKGTTMGHCGWIVADDVNYTKRNRNVFIIQQKLHTLGYSLGRAGIDGKFGPMTRAAIMAFQKDNFIEPNGRVGKTTATKLAYSTHTIANVRKCRYPYRG